MIPPEISIVIPTYNEEKRGIKKNLAAVVDFLESENYDYEVLVADDGSTDNTVAVAEEFSRGKERVKILKLPHRGKGATVRDGLLAAQGKYLLFSDADLATPIDELKRLLNWVREGYDVAIASREGVGAQRENEPYYRHLIGRVFNLFVKLVALGGIEDTQCGFKLFKAAVAKDILKRLQIYSQEETDKLAEPYFGAFDVEILFIARKLGYKIKEVPVTWYHAGTKNLNFLRNSWGMARDVLRVRLNDWKGLYAA
jgi:glycosyltransferase involved in cell wall biosynthesis